MPPHGWGTFRWICLVAIVPDMAISGGWAPIVTKPNLQVNGSSPDDLVVGTDLVVGLLNECGMYAYWVSDGGHGICCKCASAYKRLMHWSWCCRSWRLAREISYVMHLMWQLTEDPWSLQQKKGVGKHLATGFITPSGIAAKIKVMAIMRMFTNVIPLVYSPKWGKETAQSNCTSLTIQKKWCSPHRVVLCELTMGRIATKWDELRRQF